MSDTVRTDEREDRYSKKHSLILKRGTMLPKSDENKITNSKLQIPRRNISDPPCNMLAPKTGPDQNLLYIYFDHLYDDVRQRVVIQKRESKQAI
jgi:hypothetical protein